MCPHCNANLRVQDEWIGRNVRCPKCQTAFIFSDQGATQKKQNNESSVPEIYACTKCKKEYDGSTKFCCECGGKVKLTQEKNTESTKSDILSVFWGIATFIGYNSSFSNTDIALGITPALIATVSSLAALFIDEIISVIKEK